KGVCHLFMINGIAVCNACMTKILFVWRSLNRVCLQRSPSAAAAAIQQSSVSQKNISFIDSLFAEKWNRQNPRCLMMKRFYIGQTNAMCYISLSALFFFSGMIFLLDFM